jgi:hypothetical protein
LPTYQKPVSWPPDGIMLCSLTHGMIMARRKRIVHRIYVPAFPGRVSRIIKKPGADISLTYCVKRSCRYNRPSWCNYRPLTRV